MLVLLVLGCLADFALSAEILAVFPHSGRSHFRAFQPLALALAERGHHLTVVSFFPQKSKVVNYTDISLVGTLPLLLNSVSFDRFKGGPVETFIFSTERGLSECENVLSSPQMNRLVTSGKRFDLLIIELFNSDCFLALSRIFLAPFIGFTSFTGLPRHNHRLGNPDSLAYSPNFFLPFTSQMNFIQRLLNTVFTVGLRLARSFYYLRREQMIVQQVFGGNVDLQSIVSNASLVLVNSHHSFLGSRPLLPGYIEVGGLHIQPAKPLDQELQVFLDSSPMGVIVFSMGSILNSSSFPMEIRQAFMEAFAELPVQVVMQYGDDIMFGKPSNVRLSKWLPQRDILAHPKVVAFVGHGGLLSTLEAVHCGVPMVLVPVFGDQLNTAALLEQKGAAVRLSFADVTKVTVQRALHQILYKNRYREAARSLSEQFRDRPMPPLDTAIYWTEYVLRHKGALHLRSAAANLSWYQLWLIDVALALVVVFVVILASIRWLGRIFFSVIRKEVTYFGRQKMKSN